MALDNEQDSLNNTILRYDYEYLRQSLWIKQFFAFIYLFSNFVSAVCFVLLIKLFCSKKYHKVHEKNLNSLCLNLWTVDILKIVNFLVTHDFLDCMLQHAGVISSFLLFTTSLDLYLTLKSVIKDVFVEENLNRKRFLMYSICGWIVPFVVIRIFCYFNYNLFSSILKLHSALNFTNIVLIGSALRSYYYSPHSEATEGYKYFSNEKYTSSIVRFLSSIRFVFYVSFLITQNNAMLTIFDFFRAYEGMLIYYYLVVERQRKWSCMSYAEDQIPFA